MKLENVHLTRHLDLIPIEATTLPVTIIGAGAVGGWTALALAKMGFSLLTIYDFDQVEEENLGSQIYGPEHLGQNKAVALQGIIDSHSRAGRPGVMTTRFTKDVPHHPGIVISAVDSMAARREIWEAHLLKPNVRAIIDPRMGAETALLYVMRPLDPRDVTAYEKTLYTDEDAVHEPCTRKATAYCALVLAGLVCAQVKALATGQPYSRITQWDLPRGAFQSWLGGEG